MLFLIIILLSDFGNALRGHLPRAPCRPGYMECDLSDDYTYCFPVHKLCDGTLDCAGGEDELGCIRSVNTEPSRTGQNEDPARLIVTARDVALFSARIYSKLTKLDVSTYLEAERLINQVLYEGQTGKLSNQTSVTSICSKN